MDHDSLRNCLKEAPRTPHSEKGCLNWHWITLWASYPSCPQAFKILDIMPGRKQGMPMTVSIALSSPFSPLPQLRTVCGHQSKRNGPPWDLVILIMGFRASPWNTWSRSEECFHSAFPISLCREKSLSLYFTLFSHLKMKRLG